MVKQFAVEFVCVFVYAAVEQGAWLVWQQTQVDGQVGTVGAVRIVAGELHHHRMRGSLVAAAILHRKRYPADVGQQAFNETDNHTLQLRHAWRGILVMETVVTFLDI